MHLLSKLLPLLYLTASTSALTFTNRAFDDMVPGKAVNITWKDADGPVNLDLFRGGTAVNTWFKDAGEIARDVSDDYYVWTPSASLVRDVYAIRFEDSSGVPVYSFQFQLLASVQSATTTTLNATTTTSYASTVWSYPTYWGCDGACPSVF